MISNASIQSAIAQVSHNFAAGQNFEKAKAVNEARFHYSLALATLQTILDLGPKGQYCVAMPSLGVIAAEGPDELFRMCQWLADVHDRIGRIDLSRADFHHAVKHLAAAQAGYEAIRPHGIKAFESAVLLAEANVRLGKGEDAQVAASAAVATIRNLSEYHSPSHVMAYYWLYRSEAMTLRDKAASDAAARALEILNANPNVLNGGTAALLRCELMQATTTKETT